MTNDGKQVWLQRALWITLALCGLFYALRQPSYWLYGDSANFVIDANNLRRGYFDQNLEAWRKTRAGEPAIHQRLITEGGFPFLLWISRAINPNLPFTLNAFIAPLFFLAMGWLLHLTGSKRGPPLAFLLLLIVFLLQASMRFHLQRYCFPYRDMPAHTLALLSLCCALKAGESLRPLRWMLVSGWLLGIGMWFRVPVFLFIPAAAYLMARVALKQATPKQKMAVIFTMAAGGLAGLLPLFAQNIFEGKAFYQSGQMDIMVSNASLAVNQPAAATVSLSNAAFNAWPQLHLAWVITPLWAWCLIAVGLVQALRKDRLRAIVLLSVAITFYLFYACYIKPVDRYIWMVNFMLLPFAVTWIADLLPPKNRLILPVLVGLASGCLLVTSAPPNGAPADHAVAKDTKAFRKWINTQLQEPTLVATPSHALQAWIANYADPHIRLLKRWPLHRRDEERKIYELPFQFKGKPHRMSLLMFGDAEGKRSPSVWRDDILNEYALTPGSERLNLKHQSMGYRWLELEELGPRNKTLHTAAVLQTGATTLYIAAKLYETPSRNITLKNGEQVLSKTVLQSGPNLLTFPNPKSKTIELHADGPLPEFSFFKLGRIPVLRHDFTGYGNITSISNYVRNTDLIIYNYHDWTRDWGHSDYFRSTPVVRAKDQTVFRTPPQPERQNLRIYYTARVPENTLSPDAMLQQLAGVRYACGGHKLTPTTWLIGTPYLYNNHLYADVVHDLHLTPEILDNSIAVTLQAGTLHLATDLLLLRTEYQAWEQNHRPVRPKGSVIYVPRSGQKWAKGIPNYFPKFSELEKLGSMDGFE